MSKSATLPDGWTKVRIGDIIEPTIEQGLPDSPSFTYIDISAIDNSTKTITSPKVLNAYEAPSRARQQTKSGDVLVSTTRPNLNAVAIIPNILDGAIASTGFAVLRPIIIEPRWLFAVVQSDAFIAEMTSLTKGSLYPAIRPRDVYNYKMPLPPLDEQRSILTTLDSLVGRAQRLGTNLETILTMIQECRQATIQSAFSGELVANEAELAAKNGRKYEHGSALLKRIVLERKHEWEEEQGDRGHSKIAAKTLALSKQGFATGKASRALPKGWTSVTLGQLLHKIEAGRSLNCLGRPANANEWGIVKVSAMSWNEFKPSENKALPNGMKFDKKAEIRVGDILLSRSNTPKLVGASVYISATPPRLLLSDKSLRLIPSALVDSRWLQLFLSSPNVREQLSRSAGGSSGSMLNISQKDIKAIRLSLPPIAEQKRIVDSADARFAALDRIMIQVKQAHREASQLRASLLSRATAGILTRPFNQPEPISLLLEAIENRKQLLQKDKATRPKRKGRLTMKATHSKRNLLEILDGFPEGIPPDRLLLAAGYGEEEIPLFYQHLRSIEKSISELRPSRQTVLIKRRKS